MHIHVIAVAGTGMGSLAGLLRELGHQVTGSDIHFDPPMGPALAGWGVVCREGFSPQNLEPRPELVVVGNVCRRDNPEVVAAQALGLELCHIAGALQRFALEGTSPLVVAGTHGKTTTTALAAWLLDAVGLEPGFLVGGLPKNFPRSFRAARSAGARPAAGADGTTVARSVPFVIEGDEYDTAFFEKTAKFLHYRAEVAIVTSIEHDHVDIYPTEAAYVDAFRRFVGGVPPGGLVIANAADPRVVEVVREHARAPVAWTALADQPVSVPPKWLATPGASGPAGTEFELTVAGVPQGRLTTPLPGRHNVANTLAALAAASEGYGAPLERLVRALAGFQGVRRRQDLLGEPRGVRVYDDFAHHPTAVRETLAALRARHPEGALYAVFEPRSATACRAQHQDEYAQAFDHATELLLAPLGRSGIAPEAALDLARLAAAVGERGVPAAALPSVEAIVERLAARARPGDTIALLSNGAFGGIHGLLLAALGRP